MMHSKKSRTREPIDRRQLRLIHALLAFPAAGLIGFTGHAIVKSVVSESSAVVSPAPREKTTDEKVSPAERSDELDRIHGGRNIARGA